jgi:hypothetical protein
MLPDLDHFWFPDKLVRVRDIFQGVFLTANVVCDQIISKLATFVMDNHQNHIHLSAKHINNKLKKITDHVRWHRKSLRYWRRERERAAECMPTGGGFVDLWLEHALEENQQPPRLRRETKNAQ